MRKATNVGRTELMSLGTCFGKFTKSRKFKLHVTCLDHIAQYAKVPTLALPLPSCNGQVLLSACSPLTPTRVSLALAALCSTRCG